MWNSTAQMCYAHAPATAPMSSAPTSMASPDGIVMHYDGIDAKNDFEDDLSANLCKISALLRTGGAKDEATRQKIALNILNQKHQRSLDPGTVWSRSKIYIDSLIYRCESGRGFYLRAEG